MPSATIVMIKLELHPRGIVLHVRAHAGARKNAILGERQGALRVAVTAAPEKGKANRAVVALLSEMLGVSKSRIELISGETSPQKQFLVIEAVVKDVWRAIEQLKAS